MKASELKVEKTGATLKGQRVTFNGELVGYIRKFRAEYVDGVAGMRRGATRYEAADATGRVLYSYNHRQADALAMIAKFASR